MSHTHDDDRLTIGCDACIRQVRHDQEQARIAELPVRPITVEWRAFAEQTGTVVIEVPYDEDEEPWTVADRNDDELMREVNRVIDFLGDYDVEWKDVQFGDLLNEATR